MNENADQIIGRIAAVELILNQAFTISLTKFDAPLDVLTECEEHLERNLAASGLKEEQKLAANHFSSLFYSAVRVSLVTEGR